MDQDRDERVGQVLAHLKRLFLAMHERRTEDFIDGDLTLAQLRAFFVVARNPDVSVGAIGKELGVGFPAASHIVERLVQAGLVVRKPHPRDRRVSLIGLSADGRRLLEQAQNFGPRLVREWLLDLDGEELSALEWGLGAVVRAIERSRAVSPTEGGAVQ
jgi:DNA-binding MarR family transcriptional regulator